MEETLLKAAKKDVSARQEYLNLLAETHIEYCTRIIYDPNRKMTIEFIKEELLKLNFSEDKINNALKNAYGISGKYTAGIGLATKLIGKIKEMPLFVGERLFEQDYIPQEIELVLREHEAEHIKQQIKGFRYIDNDELFKALNKNQIDSRTLLHIAEIEANERTINQIRSGKYNIGNPFIIDTYKNFDSSKKYFEIVHDYSTEMEKHFINAVLKKVNITS